MVAKTKKQHEIFVGTRLESLKSDCRCCCPDYVNCCMDVCGVGAKKERKKKSKKEIN